MSADLQKRFRALAKDERVYVGGCFATQNDLSALFLVRAAHLYLRSGARLGFVLPLAALTRGQFEKLRTGSFRSAKIAWEEAWTMDDSVQPLFPVPSCAVFGQKRATSRAMPATVRAYSGFLPFRDAPEPIADAKFQVRENAPAPTVGSSEGGSPYRRIFRDGATLYPRLLCLVERRQAGRLGANPSAPLVVSRRNSQEKPPWKTLPGIEAAVEAEFLRPILLGESILPYRVFRPFEGIVPVAREAVAEGIDAEFEGVAPIAIAEEIDPPAECYPVLDSAAAADRGYGGLHVWMRQTETVWKENADNGAISLVECWNHFNKLAAQFPIASIRVVYAKAGTLPAAYVLRDAQAVIDHMLCWAAPASEEEAHYLAAILNSETARSRAERYQSRGQWGARHFDKVMFNLPIPRFEPENRLHGALADAAAEAERLAAVVELPESIRFQQARRLIRMALAEAGLAPRIDALVAQLLDGGRGSMKGR